MTSGEHVGDLFSGAYDRELASGDADRFHAHLAECQVCSDEFRSYQRSIDAVRALPVAAMPSPVHLPPGRPGRGHAAWGRPSRRQSAGIAAVALAAAGIVIAIPLLRSGTTTSGAPQAVQRPQPQPQAALAPTVGPLRAAAPATSTPACVVPFARTLPALPSTAFAAPVGAGASFTNRAVVTDPSRPGQRLEIATATTHSAPGATVRVFAQLTSSPPPARAISPCIKLTVGAQPQDRALPNSQLGFTAPSVAGALTPDVDPAGVPIQQVVVPSGLTPGTVLILTATIPAGVPAPGSPPLLARLTLTVD